MFRVEVYVFPRENSTRRRNENFRKRRVSSNEEPSSISVVRWCRNLSRLSTLPGPPLGGVSTVGPFSLSNLCLVFQLLSGPSFRSPGFGCLGSGSSSFQQAGHLFLSTGELLLGIPFLAVSLVCQLPLKSDCSRFTKLDSRPQIDLEYLPSRLES